MHRTSKRVWSGLVALAIAAVTMPLLSIPTANAAGVPQPGGALVRTGGGGAALDNGNSATTFTLRLPAGAACGGDSANDGYRVNSYIVPASVDPSTLQWNASGPIPAGVGASLRQPLFDVFNSPYVNAQTANAITPPGPGPVVNIPDFKFAVFSPGNIPAGTYNLGIACTLGAASATQMKEFWNTKMTFKTDAGGGPAQVTWVAPGIPSGNGCVAAGVPAALMSWYPSVPGSQSALKVACSFNNNTGTSQVAASFTIHDIKKAQYHDGAARRITVAAAGSGASFLTASPTIVGTGMAAWVNRVITGPGIAPRTFVTSIVGNTINLNLPTTAAVPAASTMIIENAPGARSVGDGVCAGAGCTALTSATANFTAADLGLSVSGTGIPANATLVAPCAGVACTLSAPTGAGGLTGPVVTIGGTMGQHGLAGSPVVTTDRQVTEATITGGGVLTSAIATFGATDIGLRVTGSCDQNTAAAGDDYTLPTTYITAVAPPAATTAGLAGPQSGCTIVVGQPNANAPEDGAAVANQGVQLDLNPTLVAGSGDCSEQSPEGFAVAGTWRNPGNFIPATALGNRQPGQSVAPDTTSARDTKAVGQIVFDTSVTSYVAFVLEREPATPMPSVGVAGITASYPTGVDPINPRHYDIVFPFTPTGLALCPGTASSPGLTFSLSIVAQTPDVSLLSQGVGRPGTGQLRSVMSSTTGGYTETIYARSDVTAAATNHWLPLNVFQRLCIYPVGLPNPNNFQCGAG